MNQVWSDDDVREKMREFYETHPEFAKTPEIPVLDNIEPPVDRLSIEVEDIVNTTTFQTLYLEAITSDEKDPTCRELEHLIAHYAIHLPHLQRTPNELAMLLLEDSFNVHGPPATPPDTDLIQRLIKESLAQSENRKRRG
jgi:hypothetical protein